MTKGNWIAFATLMATIIGAAWWQGSRTATKADVANVRQEIQQLRDSTNAQMQEFREHVDAQMQEILGYIIDHLDGHPTQ